MLHFIKKNIFLRVPLITHLEHLQLDLNSDTFITHISALLHYVVFHPNTANISAT